jgi:hypothetical protein
VSDEDVRALERRFRETGTVADEAAWIVARVRSGELLLGRVAVAGLCGHEAARIAAGDALSRTVEEAAPIFGVVPATLRRWGARAPIDLPSLLNEEWTLRTRTGQRVFLRVLASIDREAAAIAEKLGALDGAPTDEVIRRVLARWALSPRLVSPPAPKPRFSVDVVEVGHGPYGELPAKIEHRVVEKATGRVVLQFDEVPDFSHQYDPSYASLDLVDDGSNVLVVFADNDGTFEYVVLPTV